MEKVWYEVEWDTFNGWSNEFHHRDGWAGDTCVIPNHFETREGCELWKETIPALREFRIVKVTETREVEEA